MVSFLRSNSSASGAGAFRTVALRWASAMSICASTDLLSQPLAIVLFYAAAASMQRQRKIRTVRGTPLLESLSYAEGSIPSISRCSSFAWRRRRPGALSATHNDNSRCVDNFMTPSCSDRLAVFGKGNDAAGSHLDSSGRGHPLPRPHAAASAGSSNHGCSGAVPAGAASPLLVEHLARSCPGLQPRRHRTPNHRRTRRSSAFPRR